jgi:predicted Zn-dependent peptidase
VTRAAENAGAPDVGRLPAWTFPSFQRVTLDNGLTVEAAHMPRRYVATLVAAVDLPLTVEPAGRDGAVTAMTHLLNDSAGGLRAEDFARRLGRIGASWTPGAGHDGPRIAVEVPVNRIDEALELLALAMIRPSFTDRALQAYAAATVALTAQRTASGLGRVLAELTAAAIGSHQRFGRPLEGSEQTLRALGPADLARLHAANVGPAAATLVVAADLGGTDILAAARNAFGTWAAEVPTARYPREPIDPAGTSVVLADQPGASQAHLAIGAVVPDRAHPDWEALNVATYLLGAGEHSLINSALRERSGLSYGLVSRLVPMRGASLLVIMGSVRSDSVSAAIAEVLAIIRRSWRDGFDPDDVRAACLYLRRSTPLGYESARAVAQQRIDIMAAGLPADHVGRRMSRLSKLAAADVHRAFARHAGPHALTAVIAGDWQKNSRREIEEVLSEGLLTFDCADPAS